MSTQSTCFLQLADTERAVQAANTSLALLNPSFVRNIAFTKLVLVEGHTGAGEIDHAAEVLGDAGVLVARNRSVRLLQQLRDSRRQLEQWKRTRAVRALDDKLAAYGLG